MVLCGTGGKIIKSVSQSNCSDGLQENCGLLWFLAYIKSRHRCNRLCCTHSSLIWNQNGYRYSFLVGRTVVIFVEPRQQCP